MGTETTQEKRIRRLEDMLNALKGILEGIKHKLGQVAEDNTRDTKPPSGASSLFRCQVVSTIAASSVNSLGSGTANLLQVIGGDRYQFDPPRSVTVFNDTGGPIGPHTYCIGGMANGKRTIIVADCLTASPVAAPAPPAPGEE